MILADKIIRLRKKNGWSQEELAQKMNVSRQAVSKWEGAQTVPDLERILVLSKLFGVTTDYLLKDEVEQEEFLDDSVDSEVRRVTLAEANEFMKWRKKASIQIGLGTFLCIIAVIPLIILAAVSEVPGYGITENQAAGIGMVCLLVLAAAAVTIFIRTGFMNAPYEFYDKGNFEIEYGVSGLVTEKQKEYRNSYVRNNIIGTCLCVLSAVPLFIGAMSEDDLKVVISLSIMLFIAGIGVFFFICTGVRWASMQKILKQGEFEGRSREEDRRKEAIGTIYWLFATAVYLTWSFLTDDWKNTWVVWAVAGVLFPAVLKIYDLQAEKGYEGKKSEK